MVSRTCSIGPAVPEDVKVKIVGFQSKNISGEIQIFEGSIVDPSGNERYLVGQVSGIKEIKKNMAYFIQEANGSMAIP